MSELGQREEGHPPDKRRWYYRENGLDPLLVLRWGDLKTDEQEESLVRARSRARDNFDFEYGGPDWALYAPDYLPESLPVEVGSDGEMWPIDESYWTLYGATDSRWEAFLEEWKRKMRQEREGRQEAPRAIDPSS